LIEDGDEVDEVSSSENAEADVLPSSSSSGGDRAVRFAPDTKEEEKEKKKLVKVR
jgi:hypothetical protein